MIKPELKVNSQKITSYCWCEGQGEDTHSVQRICKQHVTYALVDVIDVGLPYILFRCDFLQCISYWFYCINVDSTPQIWLQCQSLKLKSRLPGANGCLSSCPFFDIVIIIENLNLLILLHVSVSGDIEAKQALFEIIMFRIKIPFFFVLFFLFLLMSKVDLTSSITLTNFKMSSGKPSTHMWM